MFFVFIELVGMPEIGGGFDYRYRIHSVKGFFIVCDICLDPLIVVSYGYKTVVLFYRKRCSRYYCNEFAALADYDFDLAENKKNGPILYGLF